VLPICLGRATKLADMVQAQEKSYTAEVILGITTDTGDTAGQINGTSPVTYNKAAILHVVESFQGPQMQVPPMYSAIKIDGQKLYDLARKGQTVERKPRAITIHSIQATNFKPEENSFTIDVTCSKGTYIRSLCMDIGESLGTAATMGNLLRTRSGDFALETAIKIDDIRAAAADGNIADLVLPVERVLPFPRAYVKDDGLKMAKNGNPLPLTLVDIENAPPGKVWLHGPNGLIGLYNLDDKLRLEVMM